MGGRSMEQRYTLHDFAAEPAVSPCGNGGCSAPGVHSGREVMSLSFVLVPAASWFVFGETLGSANMLGLVFIMIGVVFATR